jgi:hypothetical protein
MSQQPLARRQYRLFLFLPVSAAELAVAGSSWLPAASRGLGQAEQLVAVRPWIGGEPAGLLETTENLPEATGHRQGLRSNDHADCSDQHVEP